MSNLTFAPPVYDDLYAATDFTSLNWPEQKWAQWYMMFDSTYVATGLIAFVMHEVVYFGRCVPWMIIDSMPFFHKWKLQPKKVPTPQEQWECTKQVLFTHFTVIGPLIWLFPPTAEYFGMATYQVPFPDFKTMAIQIGIFFVFEDFFHYVAHQALHYGPLYRNIHKLHHKYSAPFGIAAEYAHPAEVFILGTGTIGGPLLYCVAGSMWLASLPVLHLFTVMTWTALRLFQAVDAHSGYDFPWSLQHILPFWSGAEHHDFHHMAFTNNYSTSFRWWDRIFGTDDKYRAYRAKVEAAKKAMANASVEEHKAMEEKLMNEIEAEGVKAEREAEFNMKIKVQ